MAKPGKGADSEHEDPPPETVDVPDYVRLVDQQLRIADGLVNAEKMWAPILASYQAFQRSLTWVEG